LPLPHKIGEDRYPANSEEKILAEAATYIWIRENCPAIPIPYLWGFGLPDNSSVRKFNWSIDCLT
jgi:hypothetical protein